MTIPSGRQMFLSGQNVLISGPMGLNGFQIAIINTTAFAPVPIMLILYRKVMAKKGYRFAFQTALPSFALGMLFGDIMAAPWEYAKQLSVDYLHPMKMNIYVPGFAENTREAGFGINMWTINDPETMAVCLRHGAGIITNFPDVAVALRK